MHCRGENIQPWSPLLDLINYLWLNDPNNSLGGRLGEWSAAVCKHTQFTHTHLRRGVSCVSCAAHRCLFDAVMLVYLSFFCTASFPNFTAWHSFLCIPTPLIRKPHWGAVSIKMQWRWGCCSPETPLLQKRSTLEPLQVSAWSASEANSHVS